VRVAELEQVTKRYGAVTALEDVTTTIEPGSIVALLGPNGAGKSTLVSLVTGLRRPDRGTVRLLGRDPRDHRARSAIAVTPQELVFPQTLRVGEIVSFAARHYPCGRPVADLLETFGLLELEHRQTGGLSVGQRRRLALVLAFVGRCALVVLDEPTAGLDADARSAVWRAIHDAQAAGAAVLLATHDLGDAEAVATRVLALVRGRLALDGGVGEIRTRAGRTRVSFRAARAPAGFTGARWAAGRVTLEVADGGAAVAALVRAGLELPELEVRPLSLEEALGALLG
jgi:ABC-2 type transport system ATP-binding protein